MGTIRPKNRDENRREILRLEHRFQLSLYLGSVHIYDIRSVFSFLIIGKMSLKTK